jgi:hypothetical protein
MIEAGSGAVRCTGMSVSAQRPPPGVASGDENGHWLGQRRSSHCAQSQMRMRTVMLPVAM